MSQTPNSGSTAYASYTDLFSRIDPRVIADWISVDGNRVGGDSTTGVVNEATVGASARVTTPLAGASGEVEAAVFRGSKHTSADLAALTGNGLAYLKDIVCGLAVERIAGFRLTSNEVALRMFQRAQEALEKLNQGVNVLGFAEAQAAGRISSTRMTAREVILNNGVTVQYKRLFGRTPDQNPYPYG